MAKTKQSASGRFYNAGPGGLSAREFADWYKGLLSARLQDLDLGAIIDMADVLQEARREGRQVFLAGNGGSATIASFFCTDFCKTAAGEGKRPMRALSLTDNVSYLTAVANDIGYDSVFVRQLENWLESGDLVFLISGSGSSPNVVRAAEFAKAKGAKVLAMTGFDGGKLRPMADICLHVPCDQYGVIEDLHQAACHMLAFYLRQSR